LLLFYFCRVLILRLNKYVQENLGISRRAFVDLVSKWQVFLDWNKIESIWFEVSGWERLQIKSLRIEKKIVISDGVDVLLFNKPMWYVCSKSDNHNKTIYEILPKEFANYFYIGRLDKDSRWLLILTNNSDIVNKYQHPRFEVEKEYLVQIDRSFSQNDFKKVKKWIVDEWELLPVKTLKYYDQKNKYFVRIILGEWKKRHIRRILNSLWYKVLDLVRVREWQFELWNLKEGCFRKLIIKN
jgi:23S rRNA pseudouridine2605 synthase